MILYEVRNGWCGESYVRMYVWAKDEWEARLLIKDSLIKEPPDILRQWVKEEEWVFDCLLDSEDGPFATRPSDSGWEEFE